MDVTAAGGTAEERSDGDLTTVRGAQKLRDWIMMKSPRIVWFCCPTENSTPSENDHLTAAQSRFSSSVPGNIASSVTCPIWHQTWHPSGQCDFVLEIPWNSPCSALWRLHSGTFERDFIVLGVPACAWGLRTDSIGYAEGGWRVVNVNAFSC